VSNDSKASKSANKTAAGKPPTGKGGAVRRSSARLAAVQALYQMDMTGISANAVVAQFLDVERREGWHEEKLVDFDKGLFGALVAGVTAKREGLDEIVGASLSNDWTVGRLELILRRILEAGAYELTERTDIPPRVVITEYVDVAHAFYAGQEPGMVNGVLDKIARHFREGEMAGAAASRS
jgi:N utilization substance protein B